MLRPHRLACASRRLSASARVPLAARSACAQSALSAALALIPCSGCGLLAQTVIGWHSTESKRETKSHTVSVSSVPPGAEVVRTDPSGGTKNLGKAPLTDTITYEEDVVTESTSASGMLIGGALELGLGIAAIAASNKGADSLGTSTGSDFGLLRQAQIEDSGTNVGLAVLGGALIYFGVQDLIVALIHGLSSDTVKERKSVGNPQYSYTARVPGLAEKTQIVRVPDSALATLVLQPPAPAEDLAAKGASASASSALAAGVQISKEVKEWVIAVMDVEDLNAGGGGASTLAKDLVRSLGDQLRILIAQYGVRTIDRGAQDRALKTQIDQLKSDSYSACYDDSCQIELGKALAASHILRSRVTRFGSRCVLNAELIDLRAEVTIKAASSKGDCAAEGFLAMSEEAAGNLLR